MTRVPCWGFAGWAFYYRDQYKIQWFPQNVPSQKLMKRLNWLLRCAAASEFYIIQFDDWHSNWFKYFIQILSYYEYYESGGSLLWEQRQLPKPVCYYLGSYPLLWWEIEETIGGYLTGRPGPATPIGYDVIDEYQKELVQFRVKRIEWERAFGKNFEDSLTPKQRAMLGRWYSQWHCLHPKESYITPGEYIRGELPPPRKVNPGFDPGDIQLPGPDRDPLPKPRPPEKIFKLTLSYGYHTPGGPDDMEIETTLEERR